MNEIRKTNRRLAVMAMILALLVSLLPIAALAATSSLEPAKPYTIDPLYELALTKITETQGAAVAQALTAKCNQLLSDIQALTAAGDKVAAHQKKDELRKFKATAVISAFGPGIVAEVIQLVEAAIKDAQARIVSAQAEGKNVVQSKQLVIDATNMILTAKGASDPVDALVAATMAGNSIDIIWMLLGKPTATPAPTTQPTQSPQPTPQPTGGKLWTTIEKPRAWDYVPTSPSQSACGNTGTTYDVGMGMAYTKLSQVPWLKLLPCDTVNIHWQPTPYKEIVFLSNRGAANKFIRITGIPGPNGELPVLDGNGATAAPGLPFINPIFEGLGIFVVSPPQGYTWGYKPGYLEISNLEIINANQANSFTNGAGNSVAWQKFASGIYIERAENVTIRNCNIHDNGNGLFQNSKYDEQGQSRYLLVEGNYIHDNGNLNSASEHNAYTEGVGTVYQFNRFGNTKTGSYGDNIKDRSVGITFRYNYIEGGVHLIDLLDPQSNSNWERIQKDAWGNLLVNSAYIYGNEMVMRAGTNATGWQNTLVRFGDGITSYGNIRSGKLYFYNNTVVSEYDYDYWHLQSITLFLIANDVGNPTVKAANNIFYAGSATPGKKPAPFSLFYNYGNADFANNWLSSGWLPIEPHTHTPNAMMGPNVIWDGTGMANTLTNPQNDPGFINAPNDNFRLQAGSPLLNAGTALDPEIVKTGNVPIYEYLNPQSAKPRVQDGMFDLGAFEN
jgi:hypothetical protein